MASGSLMTSPMGSQKWVRVGESEGRYVRTVSAKDFFLPALAEVGGGSGSLFLRVGS